MEVVMVMVPLPAQGHLNQLLNLSRLLSARGLQVHYVGSSTHNRQAKLRFHGWEPTSSISNIYFHDFHLSPPISPSPSSSHTTSTNFPAHFQPIFDAATNWRKPLRQLLQTLSNQARRVVVVHDSVMSFAADEACSSIPNGEAYAFHTVSTLGVLFYSWEATGNSRNGEIKIRNHLDLDLPVYRSFEDCFSDAFKQFIKEQYQYMTFVSGRLFNTCKPTEGGFLDILAKEEALGKKKQWAIGPLNPVTIHAKSDQQPPRHSCMYWLDEQPKDSVLYISFGTMSSISNEQIIELAIGLERSKQKFLWVLREADKGDIFAQEENKTNHLLPNGFEERVKGIIVRDWAPQLEILAHPSTGGFMSHCGWNSCMESISMGVPIAAWPMHSDQPTNAILVTRVLKVGMVVREWAQRKELVSSSVVEDVVNQLMVSEEGKKMRKQALELGVVVREAVSEGGTSTQDLESFITHVSR